MRTLARPESVTEFREGRVEVLGQHLRDGLLDHAILNRRNAQHTCASVGLRNVHALDRGGNVDPFANVREDARSVFGKVSGQLFDTHPVDPCGSFVGHHPAVCQLHVFG